MFPKIQYFPLNWENGMKLGAEHFQHLENSIEDTLRDVRASALHTGQYGLLPYSELLLRNAEGTRPGTVRVTLEGCRAILPGGRRVEISMENIYEKQIPLQPPAIEFAPVAGVRYWLYLCIDERALTKVGIPQVRPTRYPHLAPRYYLECLSIQQILTKEVVPNRMKIAEWQDGKLVEGYIPACLTLQGHRGLMTWHSRFQNQMSNIIAESLTVIQAFRGKEPHRVGFCQTVIGFIRSAQGYYRMQLPTQAPVHLIAYFCNFAGLIQALIDTADPIFHKNELKEGKINNLNGHNSYASGFSVLAQDDLMNEILWVEDFLKSVLLTITALKGVVVRDVIHGGGEQNRPPIRNG
ncbi:MAG: hypothetical protein RLZZ628_920 [Bacteroidota bacterium]